jgi:phenylacetate-CoA ligase
MRIKGWMGRADQTTKVKGMFVRPEQIAEIGKRHPELGRLCLVVTRADATDLMRLRAECASMGSLPNDGKVIADERGYALPAPALFTDDAGP